MEKPVGHKKIFSTRASSRWSSEGGTRAGSCPVQRLGGEGCVRRGGEGCLSGGRANNLSRRWLVANCFVSLVSAARAAVSARHGSR